SVVYYLKKFRVGNFFAIGIELRRAKTDVETLPLARRFARVHSRGMTVLAAFVNPTLINATAFHTGIFALFDSIAVVNLDFVAPHQVNSRIGALRYAEFDVQLNITKLARAY